LNGGLNSPSISILATGTMEETGRVSVPDGWLGLTFSPDGKSVYVGGGSRASVFEFSWNDGKLQPARTIEIVPEAKRTPADFIGDVTVSPDGRMLYAAGLYHNAIYRINLQSGRVIDKFTTGRRPYRILLHPDGRSYFVSSWADGSVYHHNADTGERIGLVRLGQHTTDMVWRPRKSTEKSEQQAQWAARLFVAASNTNTVFAVGVSESKDLKMIESINVAMTARQPAGMTPAALTLNADQSRLFVVCADANAVAVVDIAEEASTVAGFVPTGWYPTAARSTNDARLIVLNGRGVRSFQNPKVAVQTGTASVIEAFNEDQLHAYTKTVLSNSPYRDEKLDAALVPQGNPIPARSGDLSPIKHVVYIVKEGRTYDQVLGNLGKGNGDPSLTAFDEKSAPNHHKLAREFVLFDNFYANGDVAADGLNWSAAAIASDYVQKLWPNSNGGRRKHHDYEGGEVASLPPAGYIWTNALAAGISIRNYGWWATNGPKAADGQPQIVAVRDPALAKFTNRNFRAFDLDYTDVQRAQVFLEDLKQFESSGTMPQFMLLRIGNDRGAGTAAGMISPLSAMADNDYALGMIVEGLTKSRFWPQIAIFVLESDAQGADHVDSHRSPAFVLSPYTRREGFVDGTMYNTTSMLRTMELILGLRPMTIFDAGSSPMWNAFTPKADTRPYQAEKPRVPLNTRN
ncbi:MAG TPA: alkaline phosphatase family protein, partial [Bryobacteraceae bacterium]|nr:alkaline phosphatase family protein [Bryobacteraceae bacterium]